MSSRILLGLLASAAAAGVACQQSKSQPSGTVTASAPAMPGGQMDPKTPVAKLNGDVITAGIWTTRSRRT